MSKPLNHNLKFKVWSFDIDGVLNDYPDVWLDFIFQETNERYRSKEEARQILGETYWVIKEKYRTSDYKYQVPIKPDAKYLISALKELGDKIIMATTRPFGRYPFIKKRTEEWLESNNIFFDLLISKEDLYKEDFDIHIDDELKDILKVKSRAKSKSYILLSSKEINSEIEGVEVVSSLRMII